MDRELKEFNFWGNFRDLIQLKRQRKMMGQSRMENLETQATFDIRHRAETNQIKKHTHTAKTPPPPKVNEQRGPHQESEGETMHRSCNS